MRRWKDEKEAQVVTSTRLGSQQGGSISSSTYRKAAVDGSLDLMIPSPGRLCLGSPDLESGRQWLRVESVSAETSW